MFLQMQLSLKAVEAKRKRVGRGNNNIFSLQYPNLARENTNTTPHLKPGFLNASAKYQMQSPECSVNHLQPLTIREQAEQEANSKRLLCSQIQMLPPQCSSRITPLSPSLSLLSSRAAPAEILQATIWVSILVSCCSWPSYSQAWSCQTALQNPSIHITPLQPAV